MADTRSGSREGGGTRMHALATTMSTSWRPKEESAAAMDADVPQPNGASETTEGQPPENQNSSHQNVVPEPEGR